MIMHIFRYLRRLRKVINTCGELFFEVRQDCSEFWEKINPLRIIEIKAFARDPGNSNIIFAGTYGDGVFKSYDGGQHWESCHSAFKGYLIDDILIDPYDPYVVYLATSKGIIKSTDGGYTWFCCSNPSERYTLIDFDPGDRFTFYAIQYGEKQLSTFPDHLTYSSDNGLNWESVCGALNIHTFLSDPHEKGKVYVSFLGYNEDDSGLFEICTRSLEKKTLLNGLIKAMAADIKNPNILYAQKKNNQWFSTQDKGRTWRTIPPFPQKQDDTLVFDRKTKNENIDRRLFRKRLFNFKVRKKKVATSASDPDFACVYDMMKKKRVFMPLRELSSNITLVQIIGEKSPVWVYKDQLASVQYRHPPFSDEVKSQLFTLKNNLDEVYPQSIEEWEDGFRRDANPEHQIEKWLQIASFYQKVVSTAAYSKEQKLVVFHIAVQCGHSSAREEIRYTSESEALPQREIDRILNQFFSEYRN